MSVEFTWLDTQKRFEKISLADNDFEKLGPALFALKAKTGLEIDPYSDTRLSPDHASLLVELIKDNGLEKSLELHKLVEMLNTSLENSCWILVIGD